MQFVANNSHSFVQESMLPCPVMELCVLRVSGKGCSRVGALDNLDHNRCRVL